MNTSLVITQDGLSSIEIAVGDGSQAISAALSASIATTQAGIATSEASIATSAANSASGSASIASSSATSTAALLASFRSAFLGSFASDTEAAAFATANSITLSNGIMYENNSTTPKKFKIFNGTSWQDYDSSAQVSQSAAALSATNAALSATSAATSAATATSVLSDSGFIAVKNDLSNIDAVASNLTKINAVQADLGNINSVQADLTNIDLVAGDLTNINLIATDKTNIDAVAGNLTNINSVNTNSTNINAVSTNITNVNLTGGSIANVNSVGGSIGNVNAVASDLTNINLVAADKANIDSVASDLTNINLVAGDKTNIDAVAGNITSINTVNTNSTNINTVADGIANININASNIAAINTNASNIGVIQSASTNATSAQTSATAAAASATSALNAPGTSGTSTSSMTVGIATQSFTTQTGKAWVVGQFVTISSSTPANWMYGYISAYNSGTGAMSVVVSTISGAGTFTAWTIGLSAPIPATAVTQSDVGTNPNQIPLNQYLGSMAYQDQNAISSLGTLGFAQNQGAGGSVTQLTSRTTGVTLNKSCGQITLFSAAGSTTAQTFTVTNSQVGENDTIDLSVKSATNLYIIGVTAVANGSFNITFYTTGGTATDAPVFNFGVTKGSAQ